MTAGDGGTGDDLLDEFRTPTALEPPQQLAAKTEFRPWHRLRKTYLRIQQWGSRTRALAKIKKSELVDRPLKYLGLPGDDLLDIRALHGALEKDKIRLRYLGLNSTGSVNASIARTETSNLPFIEWTQSKSIKSRFEEIGAVGSAAHREAKAMAPFDVVNIDLCGSATAADTLTEPTIFKAIAELITIQSLTQGGPWLLFLTTRADIGTSNESTLKKLLHCTNQNASTHPVFDGRLQSDLSVTRTMLQQPAALSADQLARLVGLSVGKWLIQTTNGSGFTWNIEHDGPCYWYCVHDGTSPDMLSLAFKFSRRITTKDSSGLSNHEAPNALPSELDLGLGMLEAVRGFENPDDKLALDERLRTKTKRQAVELMSAARFDKAVYLSWLESNDRIATL